MRIELPPPPRKIYFAIIFMFFLLSTMSAARLFPHWHSGSGRDPRGLLFDTVLFAFFGLFNLVMFAARFSVEISRDRFRVVRHLLGVRLERSYRMAEISHLRFTPYPNDLRKGVLSFDRKGRTRWLPMVEPQTGGDTLLAQAYARFPNLSLQQKVLNERPLRI